MVKTTRGGCDGAWKCVYGYEYAHWPGGRTMRAEQKATSSYVATRSVVNARRPLARQIGPIVKGFAHCCPDTHDVTNVIWGLRERVLLKPPVRAQKHVKPFKLFVANWLRNNLQVHSQPPSFDEWLESARYTRVRKDQLRQARSVGEKPGRWVICKSFIKREFYPLFKPPRTINSRVDNYKAFAGPWFHWVEKSVVNQCPAFVKGLTPQERMHRVQNIVKGAYTYVSDFSRFESQMTKETMEICEMQLYRHYGVPERFLAPLIGVNQLKFGGVRARVLSTRMSGDMCTSLGNGFTNLMVNLYAAHLLGASCVGVVEGDDGLFATSELPSSDLIGELGFKMSVDRVSELGAAGFCSSWWTDGGETCLDVRRVISRIGWSFVCPPCATDRFRQQLLNAKLESMCELSSSTPILWKLQKFHTGSGLSTPDGYKTFGDEYWNKTSGRCNLTEPSIDMRIFVARNQGITVDDQIKIELMIDADDWNFGGILLQSSDNADATTLIGQEICRQEI